MNQRVFAKVLVVMFLLMGACKSQQRRSSWTSSMSSAEVQSAQEDSREAFICAATAIDMCVDRSQGNTVRFNSLLASASPACASKLQSFFAASDLPVDNVGCIGEAAKWDRAGLWDS